MRDAPPLVIVNPASRGGEGARDWPEAAAALRTHFGPFECRFTGRSGEAAEIAREEAERGRELLLTFGGDGTISETVRGILASGRPVALGILPHGTGADFSRSLRIPARLADAARAIRRGSTVAIDVGLAVFGDGGEKSFVNSASFGLSADVAARLKGPDRAKRAWGYARETIRGALEFTFPEVELAVEGGTPRALAITVVSLHNGRFFGGGMKMAPEASLDDGLLDVIVVKKLSRAMLLRNAPLLYLGAHLGLKEVEHGRIHRLEARPLRPDSAIPVELDGESGHFLPARFEIRTRAIRLRV